MDDEQKVEKEAQTRERISQSDFPSYPLEQALRVPRAIRDEYAKQPASPLDIAKALKMTPSSGPFRTLTSAAVAYGLTTSGGQAKNPIALTPLGRRVVSPEVEGDDQIAMCEALLKPRINKEFLTKYDGSPMPSPEIAKNVLESMGVPRKILNKTLEQITKEANTLGLLDDIGGKIYVRLDHRATIKDEATPANRNQVESNELDEEVPAQDSPYPSPTPPIDQKLEENNRVFITHGSNLEIVNQIKEVLLYGKFTPVVSVEKEATAKPVPDKVLDDMRSCGAAIVHVGAEQVLLDSEGKENRILNQNVLIEIGAAMALFGRRFILLVESETKLPSNLLGLYEVRYSGKALDYAATMKLLRAFNEFRDSDNAQ